MAGRLIRCDGPVRIRPAENQQVAGRIPEDINSNTLLPYFLSNSQHTIIPCRSQTHRPMAARRRALSASP